MYRKREREKRIKILLITVLAIVLILFSIMFLSDKRRSSLVEKSLKDGILFVEKIVLSPVNFIKNKISDSKEKNKLYNKYQDLESKMSSYESLDAENKELKSEIQELKDTLNLNSVLSDSVAVNATIINRNLGYWYSDFTIDKGSNDGILEGMPVVVGEGLIGKIIKVSAFNSVVKLLTSTSNSKISIKIENNDEYVYGLLTGYDEDKKVYRVEGISETVSISDGALVTTTGMGDLFSSGIVIGHTSGSKSDSYDLAKIVEVTPSVNFDKLGVVTVLKRNDSK